MRVPYATAGWIISNGVINLAPNKATVCWEIARVLKPGGRTGATKLLRKCA